MADEWGTDRYYGGIHVREEDDGTAQPWVEALESVQDDPRGAVTRAKNKWNIIVRDRLRNETRLGLKARTSRNVHVPTIGIGEPEDRAKAVPVRVVDGLPGPLLSAILDFENAEWAILNEATLRNVVEGTEYMERFRDDVRDRWGNLAGPAYPRDIGRVRETAEAWLGLIQKLHAKERIVGINQDVLGAYFYGLREVRLYWTAIGIVARLIDVPIEALTVVVLAHNLAHAYTHLGYDIDNGQWDTKKFSSTDLHVVEGLAQFYTEAVCEQVRSNLPEAKAAFHKLLEQQGPAFTSFREWLPAAESSGEIIRLSMIECRKSGITENEAFIRAVGRNRATIRGRGGR